MGFLNTVLKFFRNGEAPQNTGGPIIHTDEVDTKEFARVFAGVMMNADARKAVIPLLTISGNNTTARITAREMAFFKYMIGETSRDNMIEALESRPSKGSSEEARICLQQAQIMGEHFPNKKSRCDGSEL